VGCFGPNVGYWKRADTIGILILFVGKEFFKNIVPILRVQVKRSFKNQTTI
jgi:hypothetical protein